MVKKKKRLNILTSSAHDDKKTWHGIDQFTDTIIKCLVRAIF